MALNSALIGGDNVLDQLAKKGEIDWFDAGTSAEIGAGVGLVFPIGGKVIKSGNPIHGKVSSIKHNNFELFNEKIRVKNE